jgi:hypothetical protein
MRLIDEKGKLFGLVNIIDFVVILMIVLVAAGVLYKTNTSSTETVMKDIEVVLRVQNMYPTIVDSLAVGDKLVAANGYVNATITKIEVAPAGYIVDKPDGTVSLTTHPFRKDLQVTLSAKVAVVGPNISLGGQDLKVEKSYILKTKLVEANGFINSIKVK